MARVSLRREQLAKARKLIALTMLLGGCFLGIKLIEYNAKFAQEFYPSTSNFYATYFVLTGMHFVHLLGGLVVLAYHLTFGWSMVQHDGIRFANRLEVTGLYWHFVDLIWILMFATLYLT